MECINNLTEEQIAEFKEAFQIFDKDGDGCISTDELKNAMIALGSNPTDDDVEKKKNEVDKDNSGTIDFKEFLYLMTKGLKESNIENQLIEAFKIFDRHNNGKISVHEFRYVMMSSGGDIPKEDIEGIINEADNGNGYIDYMDFIKVLTSDPCNTKM